jgi:stress-induced morphogen
MPWCQPCDRYFDSERALQQHTDNSNAHAYSSSSSESDDNYECDTCTRSFATQRAVEQHMDAVGHHAPQYECDVCTRKFASRAASESHMNAVGHWQHYCQDCKRKFDNANALKMVCLPSLVCMEMLTRLQHRNSRIHRGAAVGCPLCKRMFVTASGVSHHLETGSCPRAPNLNRETIHKMIHARDPNRFVTKNQLEWHGEFQVTDNSWNGSAYECYLCHRAFSSLAELNRHVNSGPHRQKIYHCPNRGCAKEFVRLASLFNHLESESCGFIRFEGVQKQVAGFLDSSRLIGF